MLATVPKRSNSAIHTRWRDGGRERALSMQFPRGPDENDVDDTQEEKEGRKTAREASALVGSGPHVPKKSIWNHQPPV